MCSFFLWVAGDEDVFDTSETEMLVSGRHERVSSHRINLRFQLSDLRFMLSSGFHSFFITYLQKLKANSNEIDVHGSAVAAVFERSLQSLPSWCQLSAAGSAMQKRVNFLFVQPGPSNFARAIIKLKEKCPLSQSKFSTFALYVIRGKIGYKRLKISQEWKLWFLDIVSKNQLPSTSILAILQFYLEILVLSCFVGSFYQTYSCIWWHLAM